MNSPKSPSSKDAIASTVSVKNRRSHRWQHNETQQVEGAGEARFEQGLLPLEA